MEKMDCLTESGAPCFCQASCQCAPGSGCLSPPRIEVTKACPGLLNGCWGFTLVLSHLASPSFLFLRFLFSAFPYWNCRRSNLREKNIKKMEELLAQWGWFFMFGFCLPLWSAFQNLQLIVFCILSQISATVSEKDGLQYVTFWPIPNVQGYFNSKNWEEEKVILQFTKWN